MNSTPVFRSQVGKEKIIAYYDSLLNRCRDFIKERDVETSFGKTHLLEAGADGLQPLLLFHGSCTNSAMWLGDMRELSKQYHAFAVDIIGEAGKSVEYRPDPRSRDYVLWIEQLMDALELPKAAFMGNSFGGWMALKFATERPERVEKLVLLATSGITPVKFSFLLKSIVSAAKGEKGLESLGRTIYGKTDLPPEVLEASGLILKYFQPMVGALPLFTPQELSRLTMPLFYLAGENDATVDARKTADKIKKLIPHAEVEIIKGSGHVIYNTMDKVIPFLNGK